MKIKFFNLVAILILTTYAFISCKKTNSQIQRDLEAEHLQKYVKEYLPDIKPTPTGLYFEPIVKTDTLLDTTKHLIKTGDLVKVFYRGFLIEDNDSLGIIDGRQFDGTGADKVDLKNYFTDYEPFSFIVGGSTVLAGWEEAIRMMVEGDAARWVLPSRIAYAAQPQSGIPPYSPLVFYVSVYKVYPADFKPPVINKIPPTRKQN